jgi:hypothetical protein
MNSTATEWEGQEAHRLPHLTRPFPQFLLDPASSTKPLTSSTPSTRKEGSTIPANYCKEGQIGERIDQGKFRA